MEYAMGGMMENKIKRLENREASLVARGNKAVDEGRERKADRLLGRAARVDNRLAKTKQSKERQEMVKTIQSFVLPDEKKMMGGGKLDMMYQKGGKMTDPPRKLGVNAQRLINAAPEPRMAARTEKTFMDNAKAAEARNLSEMRNSLKSEGKASVARFDADLRSKGKGDLVDMFQKKDNVMLTITTMPTYKPVKKMSQGGMMKKMGQGGTMKKAGAPVPLNPTKDNNSFISNAADMSPAIKKQMMALRQAMMYFTGVSPKNK